MIGGLWRGMRGIGRKRLSVLADTYFKRYSSCSVVESGGILWRGLGRSERRERKVANRQGCGGRGEAIVRLEGCVVNIVSRARG